MGQDFNADYTLLIQNEMDAASSNAFPVIRDIIQKYSGKAKHALTAQFFGYRSKEDITALPGGFLVQPSQNVLHNAGGLIYSRPGYSLDGAAAASQNNVDGIESHYDWYTHLGFEQHLRVHYGVIEWRYQAPNGTVEWLPLLQANAVMPENSIAWDGTNELFRFAEYWNTTELVDELLMVCGDGNLYRWSGALATLGAVTNNALSMTAKNDPASVIVVSGNSGLASFSGSWTTAGNSVISGTVNGHVCGFIVMANQPAQGDQLTLLFNGVSYTITFGGAENLTYMTENLVVTGTNGPGTVRIGKTLSYTSNVVTGSSDNAILTLDNLLNFLNNPGGTNWAQIGIPNTIIGLASYNGVPFLSGSTTTAGNVVSGSNVTGVLTFAMVNNPANGDVAIFNINGQSVQVQFVSAIGVAAGNVLIGANAAATMTNLLGLLQAPTTTNANQVAFSATNALIVGAFSYGVSTGITLQGTKSWAELGFYTAMTGRAVIINSGYFTYTGGETTQTLTGVGPDPTQGGILTSGMPVVQAVQSFAVSGITSLPADFDPDLIACLNNQVFYGNSQRRDFYISKTNLLTDVSASSPRLPADGSGSTGIIADAPITAFIVQETFMYVSAGKNWWYTVVFGPQVVNSVVISGSTVSTTFEPLTLNPLKVSPGQGAQSQEAVFKIKNAVFFATYEPAIDDLGRVADNLALPESVTLTDSIKNDFLTYNLTGVQGVYNKYFLYIVLPAEQKMLVYNFALGWWEPPQVFPFNRVCLINGKLYAHSSAVPETYRVYIDNPLDPDIVYSDNGNPINAIAAFSYQNYGYRDAKKQFVEILMEGYISGNTTLTAGAKYDFGGFSGMQTFSLAGNVQSNLFYTYADGSIGKVPIGKNPVGSITDSVTNTPKFRHIFTNIPIDFFEFQFFLQSNDINQQWQLLAYAPQVQLSESGNNEIRT